MKFVYILDTNVLLDNPQALYAFPEAEVIVPQTVLAELDKLKTSRADSRLRFHGREISRILFELSEKSKLTEGIELENGAILKIQTFDLSRPIPEALKTKNSDDQILALAYQLKQQKSEEEVIMVTNDLNMLLKAQTFGIKVKYFEKEMPHGKLAAVTKFLKEQKRTILWIVVPILMIILAIMYIPQYYSRPQQTEIPPELLAQLEPFQIKEYAFEQILKKNPNDLRALVELGNLYFDYGQFQSAINMYQRALKLNPTNNDVRTDLAIAYFNLGVVDTSLTELQKVIKMNPNHAMAYFNLGIVLWQGKGELDNAVRAFTKYVELQPEGRFATAAHENIRKIVALKQKSKQSN